MSEKKNKTIMKYYTLKNNFLTERLWYNYLGIFTHIVLHWYVRRFVITSLTGIRVPQAGKYLGDYVGAYGW